MNQRPKAYNVTDANCDTGINYIVFAETRGKAIQYVLGHSDGVFDWYKYTDMRALREPALDSSFNGRPMMDWLDMEDRVAMVRLAGFRCSDEVLVSEKECDVCGAHEWCDRYDNRRR